VITRRAAADDESSGSETEVVEGLSPEQIEAYRQKKMAGKMEREKTAQLMGLSYWLEMVDAKHRYGSNLRSYHEEWMKTDTHENFFYWLDHGRGKNLELPLVPRSRLDSERVRYLSREERQNYLVKIDAEGRLCWAHNGQRISTTPQFKDTLNGIVPIDDAENPTWTHQSTSSTSSSSVQSTGSHNNEEAQHYLNHDLNNARGWRKIKHISVPTIMNQLLQKSVKPNSWIFVADTSFRLYIGIKQSGAFQHSSFLNGARISAAGLIKIKDGQIRRLSPLSGHYRPPTSNFRLFVHSLKDEGVDMSRVSISRSYAVLLGLEVYLRTRKKIKHGLHHAVEEKDKVLHPEEVKKKEEEEMDKSKSAATERRIIAEQSLKEEQMKHSTSYMSRWLGKLNMHSAKPKESQPAQTIPKSPSKAVGGIESGFFPREGDSSGTKTEAISKPMSKPAGNLDAGSSPLEANKPDETNPENLAVEPIENTSPEPTPHDVSVPAGDVKVAKT
jgi:hypothetical protein